MAKTASSQQGASSAGPIVFVGRPPLLSGSMLIDQASEQKLKLKSHSMQFRSATGGRSSKSVPANLSVTIPAHHLGPAVAQLRVDSRLAPGVYNSSVEVGSETREVVLHVEERRSMAVQPSRFELAAGKTSPVAAVLLVNDGNVPVTVPKVAVVALGEHRALTSGFHVALTQRGSQGHQSFLDAYASLLAAAEVGAARAEFGKGANATLNPGESLVTEITFQLPTGLKKHSEYRGHFMVERTRCTVTLFTAGAAR